MRGRWPDLVDIGRQAQAQRLDAQQVDLRPEHPARVVLAEARRLHQRHGLVVSGVGGAGRRGVSAWIPPCGVSSQASPAGSAGGGVMPRPASPSGQFSARATMATAISAMRGKNSRFRMPRYSRAVLRPQHRKERMARRYACGLTPARAGPTRSDPTGDTDAPTDPAAPRPEPVEPGEPLHRLGRRGPDRPRARPRRGAAAS